MNSDVDVRIQLEKVLSVAEGKTEEFLLELIKLRDMYPCQKRHQCYDMVISALKENRGGGNNHTKLKLVELMQDFVDGLTGDFFQEIMNLEGMDHSSFQVFISAYKGGDKKEKKA